MSLMDHNVFNQFLLGVDLAMYAVFDFLKKIILHNTAIIPFYTNIFIHRSEYIYGTIS